MTSYNTGTGLMGMLKEGTRHFHQEDATHEAAVVLKNMEACMQLTRMLATSLGPQGRCKLVVNHLEKITVTSDGAAMLKEMEIEHPVAYILAEACKKQEEECGDGTNFLMAVAGELMWQTAMLIGKMTWKPAPEILAGYQRALQMIENDYLPNLICDTLPKKADRDQMLRLLRPVLASKQYGSQDILAPMVADACLQIMSMDGTVSVESVRTCKVLGSSVTHSFLVPGYVAKSAVETTTTHVEQAKIVVFACGFEASATEAKGTVIMNNADDLKNYNKTEETKMQDIVASIAATGVKVVVCGGNVSDMALHFLDRYGLLCLRMGSKWELRRLCQAVRATALVRLGPPTPDEMGYASSVSQEEVGGKPVVIFRHTESKLATLVLRASTMSVLNDLERAVDDGVQSISQAAKDGRLVYGGGALEMALSVRLQQAAEHVPGLEQYALDAFGKALQVIPRTLAENAGLDAASVVANLQAAHAAATTEGSPCDAGVNVEAMHDSAAASSIPAFLSNGGGPSANTTPDLGKVGVASMKERGVVDLMSTKLSALRLAVDTTITILKIDQIIMSKPAGGPKPHS